RVAGARRGQRRRGQRKVIDVPRNRYRQCLHRQSRSGLAGGSARSPSADGGAFDRADFDEGSTVTNPRSSTRATGCYVVVTAQPTRVAMAAMLEASRTVGRVPLRLLAAPSRLGASIAR